MAAGHCGAYLSVHAGVLFEEKGERKSPLVCKSVWDYIDRLNKKAPVFYNYMFSPEDEEVGASDLHRPPDATSIDGNAVFLSFRC